ncbi:MAG: NAD(P)H-dependent oxidoreductase [Pannonibacter sp.]
MPLNSAPPAIVGLSGSFGPTSRTRVLVETAARLTAERFGKTTRSYDLGAFLPFLGTAQKVTDLGPDAQGVLSHLRSAEALIIAVPVYKGSYPGLFKHLIDLLDTDFFAGKPILLAASGGGDKHALIVEHQLRPLFAFFTAQSLGTGVYATDRDYLDGRLVNEAVLTRLTQAVEQFAPFLGQQGLSARVVGA